jgi:hypothetical protein
VAESQHFSTLRNFFFLSNRDGECVMNPMDILGSLLGGAQSSGGRGGDVLSEIFGRKSRPTSSSRSAQPTSIDQKAQELEDLLNVANDRRSAPAGSSASTHTSSSSRNEPSGGQASQANDQAVILIRAMVSAAKADGRLDSKEQQTIIGQLRDPSPEAIQFLRQEFDRNTTAREFALTVPVGMEQQVYTLSLIAIDLDTGDEAKYIKELGDSLRLSPEVREQIHQRLGAPSVY